MSYTDPPNCSTAEMMMSMQRFDCAYMSPLWRICRSGPLDEVPATSMMLPTRTALEYPTLDYFLLDGTDVLLIATSSDG